MDWPVLCPSFRLSFSFILPPFTLLTLGVPCSSIDNGGAAAPAAGSLDLLITSLDDLDPEFLNLVHNTLDTQATVLNLLTIRCQQIVEAMDIDLPSNNLAAGAAMNHIEIDGKNVEIVYPPEPQPAGTLALPCKYDGVFHVAYKDINKLSRPALLELCKQYSLSGLGNKIVLKDRIAGFSEHKIRWQCLLPGIRRPHRGVREGSIAKNKPKTKEGPMAATVTQKVKKLKPSVMRRNDLMGLPLNTPLGTVLFDTERSKDMRTLEERNGLRRWAKEFHDSHPYIPREELTRRREVREEEQAKEKAATKLFLIVVLLGQVKIAENLQSMSQQIASLTAVVQSLTVGSSQTLRTPLESHGKLVQLSSTTGMIPSLPPPGLAPASLAYHGAGAISSSLWAQTSASNLNQPAPLLTPTPTMNFPNHGCASGQRAPPLALATGSASQHVAPSTPMTVPCNAVVSNEVVMSDMAPADGAVPPTHSLANNVPPNDVSELDRVEYLTIGYGQVIKYKFCDVREPRQISFATNIARLDKVWDDEGPNWDPSDCRKNLLKINGVAIALRYWRDVFCRKKGGAWSWLKKSRIEWKYVAERYRSSSPDEFWGEFSSSNGQRFHWNAIATRLRDLRSEQDQRLVDRAKAEYGEHFSQVFVNNRGKVLTNASAISRRYLDLAKHSM
ncbi:hypothetical protein EV359DRAFT_76020 [Lentinula novae-zelandiae]|nr:hypothetical protein EV359DRAFT_76020 [Lentinula novae-zelandiae]